MNTQLTLHVLNELEQQLDTRPTMCDSREFELDNYAHNEPLFLQIRLARLQKRLKQYTIEGSPALYGKSFERAAVNAINKVNLNRLGKQDGEQDRNTFLNEFGAPAEHSTSSSYNFRLTGLQLVQNSEEPAEDTTTALHIKEHLNLRIFDTPTKAVEIQLEEPRDSDTNEQEPDVLADSKHSVLLQEELAPPSPQQSLEFEALQLENEALRHRIKHMEAQIATLTQLNESTRYLVCVQLQSETENQIMQLRNIEMHIKNKLDELNAKLRCSTAVIADIGVEALQRAVERENYEVAAAPNSAKCVEQQPSVENAQEPDLHPSGVLGNIERMKIGSLAEATDVLLFLLGLGLFLLGGFLYFISKSYREGGEQ